MPMKREEIKAIKKEAENYKVALEKAGKAVTELWKARIDMSIASGKVESIDEIIKPGGAVAWGDTGCNNSCTPSVKMGADQINKQ